MKAIRVDIAGGSLHLAFNAGAMFAVRDTFGDTKELLDRALKDNAEGMRDLCRAAVIMMEQGELIRRHMGYTPADVPSAEALAVIITPEELIILKNAVPMAISLGFGREVKEAGDDVIDLGLAEINEKKRTF